MTSTCMRGLLLARSTLITLPAGLPVHSHRFAQPLRVEKLAEEARMSASPLYSYFKEVTGMSPIQYLLEISDVCERH